MIAWTIPHPATLTGSTATTSTSSSQSSNSASVIRTGNSTNGLTLSSGSNSFTNNLSYSESASTSWGGSGTTTFRSSSSSYSFSSSSTLIYVQVNSNGDDETVVDDNFTSSSSTTESGSSSGSTALPTFSVQTSTTEEFVQFAETTFSTATNEEEVISLWTTSTSAETADVEFVETYVPATIYYATGENQTITRNATTIITQTQGAALQATVVQADPGEVLYFISNPASTWGGYLAATEVAESGTRFTIEPQFSTTQMAVVDAGATTSSSTSNALSSVAITWVALTTTQEPHTLVTFTRMPNATTTGTRSAATTRTSSRANTVFFSDVVSWGRIGTVTSRAVTTLQVTSHSTQPTTVFRQIGSVTFQSTVATTVSALRFATATVPASHGTNGISSASSSNQGSAAGLGVGGGGSSASASFNQAATGSTRSLQNNQTAFESPQITTGIADAPSRTRFVTTGAVVGNSTGGFFTASAGTFSDFFLTARNGSGRIGATIFPKTNSTVTINSDSITFLTTTARASDSINTATTQNTTLSIVVSVSGSSRTITESATFNRPRNHGGGPIGKGCTLVDVAGVGAYKDGIDGQTTSFSGAATAQTEGQSAALRSWFPVTHIGPLQNKTNRFPITFSAVRNLQGLPPA